MFVPIPRDSTVPAFRIVVGPLCSSACFVFELASPLFGAILKVLRICFFSNRPTNALLVCSDRFLFVCGVGWTGWLMVVVTVLKWVMHA